MEKLTEKLQKLGINRTPSLDELAKLVKTRELQRQRGRELAASRGPVTSQQVAILTWAKEHRSQVNAYKQQLGARVVNGVKIVGGVQVATQKYVVPAERKAEYSAWLRQQVSSDPYSILNAEKQIANTGQLKMLQAILQRNNPPQYLSSDAKTYVKRMLGQGAIIDEVAAWVNRTPGTLRTGQLDASGKVVRGGNGLATRLAPPPGIQPLPPRKKSYAGSGSKRARA